MKFKQQYAAYQQAIEQYLEGLFSQDKPYGRHGQALYSYKLAFRFTTDAGPLAGLDGKCFQVEDVDFVSEYFPNYHWKDSEVH